MSATTTTPAIERAAWWAKEARTPTAAERDEAIAGAVADGTSPREVARTVGLSHTAIQQTLKRAATSA